MSLLPHPRGARPARALPALVALGTVLGCSGARPAGTVAPASACAITATGPAGGDTLSIATLQPIDASHVPLATNAAERMVFAQLYATLIDVDCDGRLRPALARAWTLDASRTRVTLALRDDARFWDGAPVLAADVLAAWRATAASGAATAEAARRVVGGATLVDEHTLTVSLPESDLPMLADPALAVYRRGSDSPWPAGSGRYQVVRQEGRGRLALASVASRTDPLLVTRPVADPRDAIDAGVDVIVTDDPVAVSYAEARGGLDAVPLPWTSTYALAIPRRGANAGASLPLDVDSASFRGGLARDAVHAEARAAEPPFWWADTSRCGPAFLTDGLPLRRSNRIVYRRDDRVARALAERLVALSRGATAAGIAADDFAVALRSGSELAYVLDLPRAPLSRCAALDELRAGAPWIVAPDPRSSPVPLVDTRERAIVRRDRVSATILSDGTLRFGAGAP